MTSLTSWVVPTWLLGMASRIPSSATSMRITAICSQVPGQLKWVIARHFWNCLMAGERSTDPCLAFTGAVNWEKVTFPTVTAWNGDTSKVMQKTGNVTAMNRCGDQHKQSAITNSLHSLKKSFFMTSQTAS